MLRDDQRIEEIRLFDVGAFDDSKLTFPKNSSKDLAEVHIFTGMNGCGKSTLLYALASLVAWPASNERPIVDLKKRFRTDGAQVFGSCFGYGYYLGWRAPMLLERLTHWDLGVGQIYVASSDTNAMVNLLSEFQNGSHGDAWKRTKFAFVPLAYSGQRTLSSGQSLAIQEIAESPLQNYLSFSSTVSPDRILQWIANIETQGALALKENDKKAADSYHQALDAVTRAINDICEDEYSFALQRKPLKVVLKRGDLELEFDVLPDGLKSIISWIADVLMRMDRINWANPDLPLLHQPLILFLDEIDIHLHPKWQRRVLPVVQKLFPNAQIFVSTHSPFVVGSVRDAWVYNLDKKGKEIVAEPAGAGHSYEVVLEEVFGITEHFDMESQQLLARLKDERRKLLESASALDKTYVEIAKSLSARSEELDAIVSADIRQIAKHGRKIDLMEMAGGPV